ncbi:MAG: CopG family transcriptional regulator [Nitrospirae bacterium]|nr:CopG family transcriptional regulator [Nitrospirota bacterium]
MPVSIRLDKESEDILKKAATGLHTTKSAAIRDAIKNYYLKILEEQQKTPWEIYESIHTYGGSGHGKRVLEGKKILKASLSKKRKKWSL